MLDQDEGHAVTGGQGAHELPAGIEATGRGAEFRQPQSPEIRGDGRAPARGAGPIAAGRRSPEGAGCLAFYTTCSQLVGAVMHRQKTTPHTLYLMSRMVAGIDLAGRGRGPMPAL